MHANFVVIGKIDFGKSISTDHLIQKCGVSRKEKFKNSKKKLTKWVIHSFKYAWFLDKFKADRGRSDTISIDLWKFEYEKSCYTIIESPGQGGFIKNMITGTS